MRDRLAGNAVKPGTESFATMTAGAPSLMARANGGIATLASVDHGSV